MIFVPENKSTEYPDVKESVLYQRFTSLIKLIEIIRKKYPPTSKPSPEEISAREVIDMIDNFLSNVPQILNYFDKGKIPESTQLIRAFLTINSLQDQAKKIKNHKIAHPMVYEFALNFISLFDDLPENIQDIVPFLNPKAMEFDFTEGLVSIAVKAVIPGGIKSVRIKPTQAHSDYTYQITKGTHSPRVIDIQREFDEKLNDYRSIFIEAIRAYVQTQIQSTFVRSQLAKSRVCQAFLRIESDRLAKLYSRQSEELQGVLEQIDQEHADLAGVNLFIHSVEMALANKSELDRVIKQRIGEFNSQPMQQLVANHPEIHALIDEDKLQKLETAYLRNSLPDLIISYDSQLALMTLIRPKQQLSYYIAAFEKECITPYVSKLKAKYNQLIAKQNELKAEFINRANQDALACIQHLHTQMAELKVIFEKQSDLLSKPYSLSGLTLEEATVSLKQYEQSLNDVETITKQIEEINALISTKQSQQTALLNPTEQSTLQRQIAPLFDPLLTDLKPFARDVSEKLKVGQAILANLNVQHAKLKEDHDFVEGLSKSGLSNIASVITEKRSQINKEQQELALVLAALKGKNEQLNETQVLADRFSTIVKQLESDNSILNNKLQLFFQRYNEIIALHTGSPGTHVVNQDDVSKIAIQMSEAITKVEGFKKTNSKLLLERHFKIKYDEMLRINNELASNKYLLSNLGDVICSRAQHLEHLKATDAVKAECALLEKDTQDRDASIKDKEEQVEVLQHIELIYLNYQSILSTLPTISDEAKEGDLQLDLRQCVEKILPKQTALASTNTQYLNFAEKLLEANKLETYKGSLDQLKAFNQLIEQRINQSIVSKIQTVLTRLECVFEQTKMDAFMGAAAKTQETQLLSLEQEAHRKRIGQLDLSKKQLVKIHEELILLNEFLGKVDSKHQLGISTAIKQLYQAIEEKQDTVALDILQLNAMRSSLQQRIQRLGELSMRASKALDTYVELRRKKYRIKDKLLKDDGQQREKHIQDVKHALVEYQQTGDPTHLLHLLKSGKNKFSGQYLPPAFNRIIVAVLDEEHFAKQEAQQINDASFDSLLHKLRERNSQFAMQVHKLHLSINTMSDYAQQLVLSNPDLTQLMDGLAQHLQQDLHQFILCLDNKQLTAERLNSFQEKFLARLHSHDDVLLSQDLSWGLIVLNIFLALVSLGVVPIVQYASSTRYYGSFFVGQTKEEKYVNEISVSVEALEICA